MFAIHIPRIGSILLYLVVYLFITFYYCRVMAKTNAQLRKKKSASDRPTGVMKTRPKRGKHCLWTESAMVAAVEAVHSQSMSQRQACKSFGIPRATLQTRLSGKTEFGARPGHPTFLSFEQEEKVVDYACNRASLGIGFGRKQFLKYAGKYAKKYKVTFKNGHPSLKWWHGFKSRHRRLCLRQPEGTAAIRHRCMDATKVEKYFACLKSIMDGDNLHVKPECVWNMDETGVQLDHRPGLICAEKGSKYLHSRTSGNRETITIIATINAAGGSLPPHVIVKGKTKRSLTSFKTEDAPEKSTWSWSDSGWTKQGIALLWFTESFLASIGPERPQLLILDGHESHNFIELIDVAIHNNIHLVELPAHTSNWLQPCDRTVFGPFKTAYRAECDDLTSSFPGTTVSRSTFCGLLNKAWMKSITPENIRSGFRACGIFPYNPEAVPKQAYQHNLLYSSRENNSSMDKNSNCADNCGDAGTSKSMDDIPASSSSDKNESNEGNNASNNINSSNSSAIINNNTTNNNTTSVSSNVTGTHTTGITNLSDYLSNDAEVVSAVHNAAPPDLALSILESSLSPQQLECFNFCYGKGYDMDKDETFMTWKTLKNVTKSSTAGLIDELTTNELDVDVSITTSSLPDVSITSGVDLDLSVSELIFHDTTNQPVTTEELSCPDVGLLCTPKYSFGNKSYPGDTDSDVLPYPELISRNKASTKKQKFFLLTSEEAQAAKHQEKQDKEDREANKKSRQEARLKKKQETMKRKREQATKRAEKEDVTKRKNCKRPKSRRGNISRAGAGQSKETVDTTPCGTCLVRYCDDGTQQPWIQCQQCDIWFHNTCQGLEDDGPQTFVCIACDQ